MNDQAQIRVFSVDDHPLLNEGIAALINNQRDMRLVGQASSGHEAVQLYRKLQPDVMLMDLRLPDMNGIDTMIAIRGSSPRPASSCSPPSRGMPTSSGPWRPGLAATC